MLPNRLSILLVSLLIVFPVLCSSGSSHQPHILFIIADDLGYHDVGYHGADIKTPNIDQVIPSATKCLSGVQPFCFSLLS